VVEVTGDPRVERLVNGSQATYTPPGSSPVQASATLGLTNSVQPGVVGSLVVEFPGTVAPGGVVSIPVSSGAPDSQDSTATIRLPFRAEAAAEAAAAPSTNAGVS
jgi:hypothetical protein